MAGTSKGTVLIADDADTFRQMLGDALTERGYRVLYAVDGLEAVQVARSAMPDLDLMVLDLLMPKMLGFDVLKELREEDITHNVPVLVATGLFRNFSEIERVRSLGARGFLDKSLPFEELLARIEAQVYPTEQTTRESLRAIIDVPVIYKVSEGDGKAHSALTFTISTSGMFIRAKEPERVGAHLDIRLRVSEKEPPMDCKGRVVYAYNADQAQVAKVPAGMGIEIIAIDEDTQRRLIDFVNANLSDEEITK